MCYDGPEMLCARGGLGWVGESNNTQTCSVWTWEVRPVSRGLGLTACAGRQPGAATRGQLRRRSPPTSLQAPSKRQYETHTDPAAGIDDPATE